MNKILLSGLAGLAVVNAAVAVPSPADRRALCEKHPDKYVWVEKNEACIPINPCESDKEDIKEIYCIDKFFPFDISKRNLVIERFAEKKLQTSVKLIKELPDLWFSVFTTDGNYFVARRSDKKKITKDMAIIYAATAYGYKTFFTGGASGVIGKALIDTDSLEECMDIKDFASLLFEDFIESKNDDGLCYLYDDYNL